MSHNINRYISILKYYGFSIKPFSLGMVVEYLNNENTAAQFYLYENERELFAFIKFIIEEDEFEGKYLIGRNVVAYNIATNIQHNTPASRSYLQITSNESLQFIDAIRNRNSDEITNPQIKAYINHVLIAEEHTKVEIKKHNLYASAFVEALINKNPDALQLFLGGIIIPKNEIKFEDLTSTDAKEVIDQYHDLYYAILDCLNRHRPIKMLFSDQEDEYAPQAKTLTLKIQYANSIEDLATIIFHDFVQWFDIEMVGSIESYMKLATELFQIKNNEFTNVKLKN